GGIAGDRRRGAPGPAARCRRRRDDSQAAAHAGGPRTSGAGAVDRGGARGDGDEPRQEGKGWSHPVRAGAPDRRVPLGLRRSRGRHSRGHHVPGIVTIEAGLTTESGAPYNRLGMPGDDQTIVGAIRRQEERLARDPASLAFAQLADLYRKAGRTRDAVALGRNGLTRHPNSTPARLNLAKALVADGQLAPAQAELEAILETTPKDVQCHRLAAEIQRRLGHIDEAVRHLEAAVALDPSDRESQGLLSLLRAAGPPAS